MNRIKNLRRFALLALVIVGSFSLAACNRNATPYGDISEDEVYVTYGDYTVNEKELYDQFRVQGASTLQTMIERLVFADYTDEAVTKLAAGDQDVLDYFYDTVNSAIFNSTDEDDLNDLYENNPDLYVRSIEQFAETLYLVDNNFDIDGVKSALLNLPTPFSGYETIQELVDTYKLSVGERIYAKELLDEEVTDEDSDNYIEESDLVSYYQNNVQGRYDVNALVIRFMNLNEANAALYAVGLKSDSKGLWYEIPDIRISDPEDDNYVDLTSPRYAHVISILDDLNLLGKMDPDGNQTYTDRSKISATDFENYYKAYTIAKRDNYTDPQLNEDEVKAKFVEIYNLLNPSNTVSVAEDGSIVGNDSFSTTYTYDDLTALNASLRSHVYTTLTAEDQITDPTTEKAYSSRIQTFGDYRYLVFKLSDNSADDEGVLVDAEDDSDALFTDTEKGNAAKEAARVEVIKNKLTDSYVTAKVNELFADASVDIYDRLARIIYSQSNDYTGTTNNEDGDAIASVNGTDISVRDYFNEVEKSYGINLALDLIMNKYLSDSDTYTITDEEYDNYESQFEDIITAFGADTYSSYPASMGREAFLLLAFGTTSNEEAINQLYVYPELRSQYLADYEAQYGEGIYAKLAELAALQQENEKGITVSHLLAYFDNDADGTPDDPSVYLDTLDAAAQANVLNKLDELVTEIYSRLGDYSDFATGLSDIVDEFNSTGRILGSSTGSDDWVEYRQLGFYLTYENISSEITNSSNFITNNSVLDKVFYNRAINIYDTLADQPDDDSKFPYLDFYDQIVYGSGLTVDDLNTVESDFGWHFILANDVKEAESAKYAAALDVDGDYINEDLGVDVYNALSDELTASQIEYYIKLNDTDEGAPLPSSVQAAINAYLTPVLTRYNGTYMQRELIFKLVSSAEFANPVDATRFETIRNINIDQLNSFLLSEDGGVFDANYDALYGTWFDILEA